MNDQDPLSPLLRTWRHTPREEPYFNQGVWQRLDAPTTAPTPKRPASRLLRFSLFNTRWAMPLAASLVLALSLAAGSGAALAYNSVTRNDRLAADYARSIDPLQMAFTHAHR